MEIWPHDGKLYELTSWYPVPDDAWHYELTGLTGAPGSGPYLTIAIPDATPDDGPFTPMPADRAVVDAGGGVVPWPILARLLEVIGAGGDLVGQEAQLADELIALPATPTTWTHQGRRFEVNSYHHANADSWCYELYEVEPGSAENRYLEVDIPDAAPAGGPFVPMPATHVTLTMHGRSVLPWPIFRRFVAAIRARGDIVEESGGRGDVLHPVIDG